MAGQIVEVVAQRGSVLKKGDLIARIDKNDLPKQLEYAQDRLKQREVEFAGIQKLNAKGFQGGKVRLAEAEASLTQAHVELARLHRLLGKTEIRSPQAGILNERFVEEGDFVSIGTAVAKITDIDPLIVRADVTEKDIYAIYLGQTATVRLLNDQVVDGKLRYISRISDTETNTFKIEVSIPNPDFTLWAGVSAELSLPLEETRAIKISPSVMALDEAGNIGVKTVIDGVVNFHPIDLVKTEKDGGAWLGGFTESAEIIVLGPRFCKGWRSCQSHQGGELSMVNVIDAALSRGGRTVVVLLLVLLTAGSVSYFSIPKESDPDIPIPYVYVAVEHSGISPEDAERMLLRPLEQELQGLEGLKEMKGSAVEGHASIFLEFQLDVDQKQALADVREKADLAKGKLPAGTDDPTVHEITMAGWAPVVTVVLSGSAPERTLIMMARELQDKLETLQEVLEVEIGGDRDEMVEILVAPLLMESYNLDQAAIYNLLSRNNRLVAAGNMDNGKGRFPIKVPSVFESISDVLSLPVKVDGDRVITFGDIAEIRRVFADPNSFARLNGKPAITLEVKKRAGENAIETVNQVRDIVAEESKLWPANVQVDFTGDTSENVKDMLADLQNNVASAVLLVVIVIIAILGGRSAALVGISIPGSFLTGILVLSAFGMTMNMMVLFGLIMAVGMLVDGAIVVTEFADREMSEGAHRKEAYRKASNRMAWPIIASTATTLAAFAPLLFWPGLMGEFMKYLPLTLIFTLSASLVMALIFVPTLGTLFGKPRLIASAEKEPFSAAEQGELTKLNGFTGLYVRTLKIAIYRPWLSLGAALIFSAVVFMAFGMFGKGVEFFPETDTGGF